MTTSKQEPLPPNGGGHDWLNVLARRVSNWNRWGPDDERGTLNLITRDHVARAAALVRRGDVFDLGIPIDKMTPQPGDLRSPPLHVMTETGEDQNLPNGFH